MHCTNTKCTCKAEQLSDRCTLISSCLIRQQRIELPVIDPQGLFREDSFSVHRSAPSHRAKAECRIDAGGARHFIKDHPLFGRMGGFQ